MSKIWIFDSIENNCDVCKGEDCMKNFCKPLALFRIDFFGAAHGWSYAKWAPLPKICHIYPTVIKLGTAIPLLKKIQKIR